MFFMLVVVMVPYKSYTILPRELIQDIDAAKHAIANDVLAEGLSGLIRTTLEEDSLAHSGIIEGEFTKRELREKKRESLESLERLKQAWGLAQLRYQGELHDDLLTGVANTVNNTLGMNGYRTTSAMITAEHPVIAIRPEKIQPQLQTLFEYIQTGNFHPVEQATLAHFHIARIHPFSDGNGRTARIIQNAILSYHGYPPATVTAEERSLYINLIAKAREGFIERESEAPTELAWQRPHAISNREFAFFTYLGSRVNMSLGHLVETIERFPHFKIELIGHTGRKPASMLTVKKHLDAFMQRGDHLGQARLDMHETSIEVKGDISAAVISSILDKNGFAGQYRLKTLPKTALM